MKLRSRNGKEEARKWNIHEREREREREKNTKKGKIKE